MSFGEDDRDDFDDFSDRQADDETGTIGCPHCRAAIFEEAEQCPECGTYLTEQGAEPQRKPWWIVIGTVACLAVVYLWIRYGS
jgi:hypothetical protein